MLVEFDGAVACPDITTCTFRLGQVMANTEDLIRYALAEGLSIVLVVNKIDRLILELRLPPAEAYYKIKHTIEEVNSIIASVDEDPEKRVSPERGNVSFASSSMGWCFTLGSFAELYSETYGASSSSLLTLQMHHTD